MHLWQSISAYDNGYDYESDPMLGNTSTYNRLNRLISRLLLNPERLAANGSATNQRLDDKINLRTELETVRADIEKQESDSVWTAADLALLDVILGHKDAASAYAGFERKNPPDFACQSALDVVAPLATLELPTATELKSAERRLTALRERAFLKTDRYPN